MLFFIVVVRVCHRCFAIVVIAILVGEVSFVAVFVVVHVGVDVCTIVAVV